MTELLSAWQSSKERGEEYARRRGYLDAMEALLQQAYDADAALVEAADKNMPSARLLEQWPELQKADRFYTELWNLVEGSKLSIRTSSKQVAEKAQPTDPRPLAIEEPDAAA